MKLGVILPHIELYGGIKRFVELGGIFVEKGHTFTIFTPTGTPPNWIMFKGDIAKLDELSNYSLDVIFFTETQFIENIVAANAKRKIFYFVRPTDKLQLFLDHYPEIEVFANSTTNYNVAKTKFKINPHKAIGGINIKLYNVKEFAPKGKDDIFTIMCFGRLAEKRKGTMVTVKACEKLRKQGYNIKLLLFDTPVNEKMQQAIDNFKTTVPFDFVLNHPVEKNNEMYKRADIFVAAERKTGYANTAVEAMASGVPVVGTTSGTQDFLLNEETGFVVRRRSGLIAKAIKKIINSTELQKKFAVNGRAQVEQLDWHNLADNIESELSTT